MAISNVTYQMCNECFTCNADEYDGYVNGKGVWQCETCQKYFCNKRDACIEDEKEGMCDCKESSYWRHCKGCHEQEQEPSKNA